MHEPKTRSGKLVGTRARWRDCSATLCHAALTCRNYLYTCHILCCCAARRIRQRQGLEDQKPAHVDEVVLIAPGSGALPEGTQTNFFAVRDGTLFTAGDGVLEGTVRRVVLEVCARDGIPVEFVAPNVADVMDWEGAFVSSTSRLVLPIDEIVVPVGQWEGLPEGIKRKFEGRSLVHEIEEKVMAEINTHSLNVMES